MNYKILGLLLMLMSGQLVFAQEGRLCQAIYVDTDSTRIEAEVTESPWRVALSHETIYHWTNRRQIFKTQGGYDGLLLDGNFIERYISRQLKAQGKMSLGIKVGEWRYWREDGTLQQVEHWKSGRLHGATHFYNSKGQLIESRAYRKGLLHGKRVLYQNGKAVDIQYFKKGKMKEKKEWNFKMPKLFKKKDKTEESDKKEG